MSLEKVLHTYGLKESYAKVYLACLELGSASVLTISKKAGVARSTTEVILNSLKERGFVYSFKKKQANYFTPEDPRKMIAGAREKVELLEKALPSFNSLYNKGDVLPTIRVYQNVEHMKVILREILDEADSLIGFGSVDDIYRVIGEYFPWFTKERIKKGIHLRIILRDSPLARMRQKLGPQELREVRIIPESSPCSSLTFIWKNKLTMFSLQGDTIAVIIESKELASIQRAMFELIWGNLPEKITAQGTQAQ